MLFRSDVPITAHIVYRPSLFRRLVALEKKMGISPEERYQDDPLAVAEEIYVTGVRLRNAPIAPDREIIVQVQELPLQRVLLFPVIKPALKAGQVATSTAGVPRVRMDL